MHCVNNSVCEGEGVFVQSVEGSRSTPETSGHQGNIDDNINLIASVTSFSGLIDLKGARQNVRRWIDVDKKFKKNECK